MLIDSLTFTLEKSGCLDAFWGKLDEGLDGTLGVASSARPFLVAARFAHRPQTTLVVVAGEEAAIAFARQVAAYLGDERVMRFPERSDYPWGGKPGDPAQAARRLEAVHALASGREAVVVASARALVRALPPAGSNVHLPLVFEAGRELADMEGAKAAGIAEFGDVARALEERGYQNTGELDGPGTFAVRGGTMDVFPGNLVYPVRLDFFGDELDEIRRIVPTTGQTIASLPRADVYPVVEFAATKGALARARQKLERPAETNAALRDVLERLDGGLREGGSDVLLPYLYKTTSTLGDYVRPGSLSVLVEPRSLFDDMTHAYEDLAGRAKGTGIALEGLYAEPASVSFGDGQRATYVSIMRVGGQIDDELPVKRVEVAGHPDKLYGRLRTLVDGGYTVVFSAPNFRARQDMKLASWTWGRPSRRRWIPTFSRTSELPTLWEPSPTLRTTGGTGRPPACCRLRRGVVNVVDATSARHDHPEGEAGARERVGHAGVGGAPGAGTSTSRTSPSLQAGRPRGPAPRARRGAPKELVRRDVTARRATTCCWSTPRATSSTCRWSSWTA